MRKTSGHAAVVSLDLKQQVHLSMVIGEAIRLLESGFPGQALTLLQDAPKAHPAELLFSVKGEPLASGAQRVWTWNSWYQGHEFFLISSVKCRWHLPEDSSCELLALTGESPKFDIRAEIGPRIMCEEFGSDRGNFVARMKPGEVIVVRATNRYQTDLIVWPEVRGYKSQ